MPRDNFSAADQRINEAFKKKRRETAEKKELDQREQLKKYYQKAVERLEAEGAINPDDFDNYDPMVINEDMKYVDEMKKKFAAEKTPESEIAKELSTVLEAILHDQIELNEWLGPNATTRKASEFDDIRHGIDSIVEFDQETGVQHLALALDVTYSSLAHEKLKRIKGGIDRGQLSTVKYYESGDGSFKGSLNQVPRVVIGIDRKEIMDLAELWDKRKNKELGSHLVQFKLLDEIEMQLRSFQVYAEKIGQLKIADIYSRQIRLIESIKNLPEKLAMSKESEKNVNEQGDRVFSNLREGLKIFDK